jgi:hypothetical protein
VSAPLCDSKVSASATSFITTSYVQSQSMLFITVSCPVSIDIVYCNVVCSVSVSSSKVLALECKEFPSLVLD